MEVLDVQVEERTQLGKGSSGRTRRSGMVPGVIYTGGDAARAVQINTQHFNKVVGRSSRTQLFQFKSESGDLDGTFAMVKDVQIEPLKQKVLHVDFLEVRKGQRISVTIPIVIQGESLPVKQGICLLNQTAYELEMECLPFKMPESIVVDISGLKEGDSIHAGDVELPEDVVLRTEPKTTIVSLIAAREEETAAPAEEGEEAADAAAEAPSSGQGDAPAAEAEKSE